MTQNYSLLQHKGNFPGISRNNKTTQICLKYSLRCAGASILERYLKNNRLSPKTMVQKSLSLATYKLAYACINFIQPTLPPFHDKPRARLEGGKNPSPGTIIVHKNPHLGTKQGVKSPTLETKYLKCISIIIYSDTI